MATSSAAAGDDNDVDNYLTMDLSALLPESDAKPPAGKRRRRGGAAGTRLAGRGRGRGRPGAASSTATPSPAPAVEAADAVVVDGEVLVKPRMCLTAADKHEVAVTAALSKPLDASNKGFKMLAKLGYKPGQGLGKDASGRAQPVPVSLRHGRGGVGTVSGVEAKKRQRDEQFERQLQRARAQARALAGMRQSFRVTQSQRFAAKSLDRLLSKASRQLEELDTRADDHTAAYMWPQRDGPGGGGGGGGGGGDGGGGDDLERNEDGEELAPRVLPRRPFRNEHGEIMEIGARRDAAAVGIAPGDGGGGGAAAAGAGAGAGAGGASDAGAVHLNDTAGIDSEAGAANGVDPESNAAWLASSPEERLVRLLHRLRSRHHYCLFCAVLYNDVADLDANCPGFNEDDH